MRPDRPIRFETTRAALVLREKPEILSRAAEADGCRLLRVFLMWCAEASRLSIDIDEAAIPIREDVRGACEILGFDPLYVANEGRGEQLPRIC